MGGKGITLTDEMTEYLVAHSDPPRSDVHDRLIAATAAAMQALAGKGVASVTSCLTDLPLKERDSYWKIRFQAAAAEDAVYRYETTKSRKSDSPLPSALALWLPSVMMN